MMTVSPRETGTALLTVLLLVAVMATVAATALDRLGLATRLAGNARDAGQARAWLASAELLATTRIEDLRRAQPNKVTLAGNWLGVARTIDLPDGTRVSATLGDGGNCFNLNALVRELNRAVLAPRPEGRAEFEALMKALGFDAARATRIAAAATDYIDDDDAPLPGGVEQSGYPQGSRPANRMMTDRSELRIIPGVSAADAKLLARWTCALPLTGRSPINVNTLRPEEAPLLAMLYQGRVDVTRARTALASRPAAGYDNGAALFQAPALAATPAPDDAIRQVGAKTDFFTLDATIIGRDGDAASYGERALIDASQTPARVLSRSWGDVS